MEYVESFDLLGVAARQKPCLTGSGVPAIPAVSGELYLDTSTGDLYRYVSGVWRKGGSTNILAVTMDSATNTASHSYSEIAAAVAAGKLVVGVSASGFTINFFGLNEYERKADFATVLPNTGGRLVAQLISVDEQKQLSGRLEERDVVLFANFFPVTINFDTNKASHSPAEIKAAQEAGKVVFTIDRYGMLVPLFYADDTEAVFQVLYYDGGKIWCLSIGIDENKNVSIEAIEIPTGSSGSTGSIPTIDTVALGLTVTVNHNEIEVTEEVYRNLVSIAEQGTARLRFLVNYGTEEDPYPIEFTQIAHILKCFDGEAYSYEWYITIYTNEIARMALFMYGGKYYLAGRYALLEHQQ